jgi:choice-of-anchor B domain-containing protein
VKRLTVLLFAVVMVSAAALPAVAQSGFGRAVAVGDEEVFVGEPDNSVPSGFVYVYRMSGGAWQEVEALTADDASDGDGFGSAVATRGDELLVGAVNDERGIVYVFERDGRDWRQTGTLAPAAGTDGDGFGSALLLDGDTLYVGATRADDNKGATYVFRRGAGGWQQVARLAGDEIEEAPEEGAEEPQRRRRRGPSGPQFGSSIAATGEHLLIGAPGTSRGAGMVYAYRRDGTTFERVGRFPEEGATGAGFGSAITMYQGAALIGAAGANSGVGAVAVYRFDEESAEWRQQRTLQPFEANPGAAFGTSIVAAGDEIYVGSPGASDVGAIFRFALDEEGNATSAAKMGPADMDGRAQFAGTLALRNDVMVAGLPGDDRGAGTAMIMTRGYEGWDRTKVLSEMKGLPAMAGELIECTDGMIDRYPCKGVDVLAFLPFREMGGSRGMTTNDIWGWTDPETGKDYALVCMTDKMSFVDVTDPYNPIFIGTLPMTEGARPSTWRDIKVSNDHGYIVSDGAGEHGVQVFDLTRLREFSGEPIVFTEDAHYDGINSAHNIVINEDSRFAFVVGASGGGETCGGGLHMINIEDPTRPAFAGCFADVSTGRRGTGYSHDAQCVIYDGPDTRYTGHEICFGSNETALSVADVTDKRNPVAIGMSSYPNVAYTHQGWLTEDHAYFYMNDEGDEPQGLVAGTRTLVWDVRELDDPVLIGEYIADVTSTDHNLYVVGDVMYQSNYDSGLRVFDVSNPADPQPIGYFDTNPEGMSGASSWSNYPFFESGIVAFTAGRSGLFIAKLREDAR